MVLSAPPLVPHALSGPLCCLCLCLEGSFLPRPRALGAPWVVSSAARGEAFERPLYGCPGVCSSASQMASCTLCWYLLLRSSGPSAHSPCGAALDSSPFPEPAFWSGGFAGHAGPCQPVAVRNPLLEGKLDVAWKWQGWTD